jgi:hypothetical protein
LIYTDCVTALRFDNSQEATDAPLARVRGAALESLMVVTERIPYTRLFPFKAQVSRQLQRALDDRKKAVRVLAGRVRNKWLVMK